MTHLGWLHCAAGASGDMLLGAIVDVGVPLQVLQAAVDAVVGGVRLSAAGTSRHGLVATAVRVEAPPDGVERTWRVVRELLEAAALAEPVRAVALDTFGRLAAAEARVHGTEVEQVHFHEVGGLDAIADVVGVAAGLVELDLAELSASPVAVGLGSARGRHGVVPVPAPATLALLTDAGAPVESGPAPGEACTPTGAALLAATVTRWGGLPPMRVRAVGVGAGARDPAELPNVVRLVLGEPTQPRPEPDPGLTPPAAELVVEANVDDLDPRLWPGVLTRLLAVGAADAWLTPILMKKGRPAHTLSVLAPADAVPAVRAVVFRETSTIGVRSYPVDKHALPRATVTVDVGGRPVRVKTATHEGEQVSATPEFEDVVAAAAVLGRPVKAVLAEAAAAATAAAGAAAAAGAGEVPG